MGRLRAALGSLAFLAVAPGVVAGLVPWSLTHWHSSDPSEGLVVVGAVLTAAGGLVLLHAFGRFVIEGIGTPAPIAPTERLVVGGAYRYVRNPMYLAIFFAAVSAFVYFYEEPALEARYGDEYTAYRKRVPRWVPRFTSSSPSARAG